MRGNISGSLWWSAKLNINFRYVTDTARSVASSLGTLVSQISRVWLIGVKQSTRTVQLGDQQ